ncbi:5'-methylthioadenosine/adenosylhomocysteine nucleosidase [Dyadobacter sp. CY343]|uniref:5'-methylthioadenosine/adenosylhomocysteine nucleosidase n=1 Tax=Dyadobacter sp. CY343 TaxID=2907299 RepID=UPI001F243F5C|nr:5'-methylthioadenosine/adenosylhomocysteine nucleosidase [Dyadobacter sp. CY343]MCE7060874.1 5'-methylthioadenosine/adenosylhomocysteine nucleosidase [Dyadobacter sp. CY343]
MKKVLLLLVFCFVQIQSNAQEIIGILGAFPPELKLLRANMVNPKDTVIRSVGFITGELKGRKVVVAQTGVGKVNAAITTTIMLDHFRPRQIIFSGIAGAVNQALRPGDIVIGTEIAYHDFGALTDDKMDYWATKNPLTDQPNPTHFKCDPALVQKAIKVSKGLKFNQIAGKSGTRVPAVSEGIIVTGDVFVSSKKTAERLRKDLNAAATEMEGAAIAQTCFQQNVPFLIIRSMSDNADDHAAEDMGNFYDIAAANAATLVMAVVEAKN